MEGDRYELRVMVVQSFLYLCVYNGDQKCKSVPVWLSNNFQITFRSTATYFVIVVSSKAYVVNRWTVVEEGQNNDHHVFLIDVRDSEVLYHGWGNSVFAPNVSITRERVNRIGKISPCFFKFLPFYFSLEKKTFHTLHTIVFTSVFPNLPSVDDVFRPRSVAVAPRYLADKKTRSTANFVVEF